MTIEIKSYRKKYYEDNKEILLNKAKEKYKQNKLYFKNYYKKNKDNIMSYQKRYHENNKEYSKNYYQNNKNKIKVVSKKWREENKEHLKKYKKEKSQGEYLKKYGLTKKDYNKMVEQQNNKCAICGNIENGKRLAVDHNWKTGQVRGLLCKDCNVTLGNLKEDISLFYKCIEYLKKWESK